MIAAHRRTLLRLFEDLHRLADDPSSIKLCADIQTRLLQKVLNAESHLKAHRTMAKALRAEVATKTEPPRTREAARRLKHQVAIQEARVRDYRDLAFIVRTVGDGIAFIYLDKWDIKPLSSREAPGFISGKTGLKEELRLARRAWRRGICLILNDLTNCLRHGDVTVPRPDKTFLLMEVKSGRKGTRGNRQETALAQIDSYLATDEAEDLYGNLGRYRRIASGSDERDHLPTLNDLIGKAHRHGSASAEVEPGLYYACVEQSGELTERALEIRARCRGTPIFAMVNAAKFDEMGYKPFTLSIRDPEAALRFWLGQLIIAVIVDSAAIDSGFERRGYSIALDLDSSRPLSVYSPRSSHPTKLLLNVGSHYFNRLFTEFLSLDWMITETLRHPVEELAEEHGLLLGKTQERAESSAG